MRGLKRLKVLAALVAFAAAAFAIEAAGQSKITNLKFMSGVTTTAKSGAIQPMCTYRTYQAAGATSAGSGAATVVIQGSNTEFPSSDGDWVNLGTISLTLGTTRTGDGFASQAPWKHVRGWVSSISGTNAAVDGYVGCGG